MRIICAAIALLVTCNSYAQDMTSTATHYLVTRSNNLTVELERLDQFAENALYPASTVKVPKLTIFGNGYILGEEIENNYAYNRAFGLAGIRYTASSGLVNFSMLGGISFYAIGRQDYDTSKNRSLHFDIYYRNFQLDSSLAIGSYFRLEVGGNVLNFHAPALKKDFVALDSGYLSAAIPVLGPYGKVTYDFGNKRIRDLETGLAYSFGNPFGFVSAGYTKIAKYDYNGLFIQGDSPDITGTFDAISRVFLTISQLNPIHNFMIDSGIAMRLDSHTLGREYVQLGWSYRTGRAVESESIWSRTFLYARVSNAYSSIDHDYFQGFAAGMTFLVPMEKFVMLFRVEGSFRDYDSIERIGDINNRIVRLTMFFAY